MHRWPPDATQLHTARCDPVDVSKAKTALVVFFQASGLDRPLVAISCTATKHSKGGWFLAAERLF